MAYDWGFKADQVQTIFGVLLEDEDLWMRVE